VEGGGRLMKELVEGVMVVLSKLCSARRSSDLLGDSHFHQLSTYQKVVEGLVEGAGTVIFGDLINVRFAPLCGLKSDISRGLRSARKTIVTSSED
jgi:hypothetical protein